MNRAILMALVIAPLFTAGIAVGGIQNANAEVQIWTLTLVNSNSERSVQFTHSEFGDCEMISPDHCDLNVSDGKLRKCVNGVAEGERIVSFEGVKAGDVIVFCNGPWTVKLVSSNLPSENAFIHF